MKLLLIVGCANDIFIYNMAKWLKASMEVDIDIFEFYPSNQQTFDYAYYNHVESVNPNVWHNKIKGLHVFTHPFYASNVLKRYIKDKYYDIIHCHWIVPPLVLTHNLHKHCSKLFVTFWGKEYKNFKILNSWNFYKKNLDKFMKEVDVDINAKELYSIIKNLYPQLNIKYVEGYLGAASLDYLYDIMYKKTKSDVKKYYEIPTNKVSILIGYSGKELHQHIPIIEELAKRDYLKDKLHLLAPMTRGGGGKYTIDVEQALAESGYSYTVLKDRFFTDEEIAMFRYATDITLQLSTTDAFSRSIVECLCAKSIMIYGEWLNYSDYLQNEDFSAVTSKSIHDGVNKMEYIIDHMSDYKTLCEQNSNNGKARNIWSECIKDWVNAYKEVL